MEAEDCGIQEFVRQSADKASVEHDGMSYNGFHRSSVTCRDRLVKVATAAMSRQHQEVLLFDFAQGEADKATTTHPRNDLQQLSQVHTRAEGLRDGEGFHMTHHVVVLCRKPYEALLASLPNAQALNVVPFLDL